MKLLDTFEPNSFDGGFQVEAFAHAPDRMKLFKDLYTILKPGALFAGYDWVVTPRHDPNNPEHERIKKSIELGNSLPDLPTIEVVLDAIKANGFEVLEYEDIAERHNPDTDIPWYDALDASWSWNGFKHTRLGRYLTDKMIWVLETAKLAPKGTGDIHKLLTDVAHDLALSGKLGTFSPMFFYVIRKPMK
jgi:sterol 24-C-methyltransferase